MDRYDETRKSTMPGMFSNTSYEIYNEMFEIFDSQLRNGGIYQYWYNTIQDDVTPVRQLLTLCKIGVMFEIPEFDSLQKILSDFLDQIKIYHQTVSEVKTSVSNIETRQRLLDAVDEQFASELEGLDCDYDSICDEVRPLFLVISKLASLNTSRVKAPLDDIIAELHRCCVPI